MPGSRASEEERRHQILTAAYQVAGEQGLGETTVLQVAAAAGVSPGLVIFHFKSRRQLLLALLEQLLATTTVLRSGLSTAVPAPAVNLLAVLRQEIHRLTSEPVRIRLTFDYWMAGVRDLEIRDRLQEEFARYRQAFRPLAEIVLREHPDRFPGVTADGLAGLSVSLIKGCAVQSMIDPDHFDVDEYLTAAIGLLSVSASSSGERTRVESVAE